ncbi:hypothetical protein I317_06938 [Kwoniella heveanensis CBS 569]|nr:hypothetical protein I317_06938 [Kwoniella heveanensis CBS 569]
MSSVEIAAIDGSMSSLSFRPSPAHHQLASIPSPSTESNSLHPLSAIHPHLLDVLRHSSPALFVRVSKAFYDDLVPIIYRHIRLTEENVWRVLERSECRRKAEALGKVKELEVDLEALRALAMGRSKGALTRPSSEGLSDAVGDVRVVSTFAEHAQSAHQTTGHPMDRPFSNVETLHLPWSMINTLSAEMHSTDSDSDTGSEVNASATSTLSSALAQTLSKYVRASAIHLDLRGLVTTSYWALDSVITTLLSRSIGIADQHQRRISLELEITLPPESPERGYIPHRLSVPSIIRFRPHPLARNEHYARVIRDHHDVHTSRDWWPAIEYWVDDSPGMREELEKMIEASIRVHPDLVMDEIDGGVLRQVQVNKS